MSGLSSFSVSPAAVEAISQQIEKRNVPGTALRVGVRGGGCSGLRYAVEFHDGEPLPRDLVLDLSAADGSPVRVLVDHKSLVYLAGAVLEWESTLLRRGFRFANPNEGAGCGCGESFTAR